MFSLLSKSNKEKEMIGNCTKCNHGIIEHGCDDGIGWCGGGNGDWCDCKEPGETYEEALKSLT
jgi:hypothetical protein|tara:strand:+ start:310 stop:498 length:189 start_codon:yes stop_codon:yes gene_type:complete